jgi:hypothetical protein
MAWLYVAVLANTALLAAVLGVDPVGFGVAENVAQPLENLTRLHVTEGSVCDPSWEEELMATKGKDFAELPEGKVPLIGCGVLWLYQKLGLVLRVDPAKKQVVGKPSTWTIKAPCPHHKWKCRAADLLFTARLICETSIVTAYVRPSETSCSWDVQFTPLELGACQLGIRVQHFKPLAALLYPESKRKGQPVGDRIDWTMFNLFYNTPCSNRCQEEERCTDYASTAPCAVEARSPDCCFLYANVTKVAVNDSLIGGAIKANDFNDDDSLRSKWLSGLYMSSHWNDCSLLTSVQGSPFSLQVESPAADEAEHELSAMPLCTSGDAEGYWKHIEQNVIDQRCPNTLDKDYEDALCPLVSPYVGKVTMYAT